MELDYVREGAPPPEGVFGESPRPDGDVFGGWYATVWTTPENPPSSDDEACQKFMEPYEELTYESKGAKESARPFPGWPGPA